MRVTGIALTPPAAAARNPTATPELLAASLAKYSRSTEGIETILGKVDPANADKSVEAIFKFIDYGHASIGGLTGGIPMAIDGVSMYLAYKLFQFSQMCDGQESSTRYIKMGPESLPEAALLGIPAALQAEWKALMTEAFARYEQEYKRLDKLASEQPDLIKYPANANEKVRERIRKNYALDRARYFIPLATRTNCGLVMTARMWAQTIKQVDSLASPEAKELAGKLRDELGKFAPRLIKHSAADAATLAQERQLAKYVETQVKLNGVPTRNLAGRVEVSVDRNFAAFAPATQSLAESVEGKANRYSLAGEHLNRIFVRAAWNNIALAELRDLNRHRTGYRFTPLVPVGFYLPAEIERAPHEDFLARWAKFCEKLVAQNAAHALPCALLLGTQVSFEHAQMADKFVYEVELRTGMGAHFRYAEHLAEAAAAFFQKVPEAREFTHIGTAEPE